MYGNVEGLGEGSGQRGKKGVEKVGADGRSIRVMGKHVTDGY